MAPLAMALGCMISGPTLDRFGRKLSLISLVLPFLAGWLLLSFGTSIEYLLAGRFITGVCAGAYRTMALVFLSEVTDPKHRGMSLISTSLATNIGALTSHITGTYMYWRFATLTFCIPIALSFILLLFLKESPLWLLSKGKTEKGTEVFKWYRNGTAAADEELQRVIERQKCNPEKVKIKELFKMTHRKPFMKAFLICTVIFVAAQFCGVNTLTFYAIDLLDNTFGQNIDAILIMVVIDMIRVTSTLIVFLCAKYMPRRPLFLFCAFGSSTSLLGVVLYIYLDSSAYVWFGLTTMIIFISLSSTMVSMAYPFPSELYPNNVRGVGSAITSTVSFLLLFLVIKITPGLIESFGMAALYVGNAVLVLTCAVILCFILPETNGKSLQEIEDNFNNTSNRSKSIEHNKV